ncbi:MAG: SMP-30/gluconolactonase/LRE family protein [Acidobacteria bacterium]|nr:SMP-30/gluconolactonase/LRE family protein [Acidobacteriota bacterium]
MRSRVELMVLVAAVALASAVAAAQNPAAPPKPAQKPLVDAIGVTDPGPLPPGGPAPRMADGKPDLSGIWFSGVIGRPSAWSRTRPERVPEDPVPFRPEAAAKIKSLTRAQLQALDPTVNCLPRGVPGMFTMNPHPFELITFPGVFVQLVEAGNQWRKVSTDKRPHPEYPDPLAARPMSTTGHIRRGPQRAGLRAGVPVTETPRPFLKVLLCASVSLWLGGAGAAQERQTPPPPRGVAVPAIPGVIAPGTTVDLVNGSFRRTEGPVGMPDGSLLFTEADRIIRIDAAGRVSTFVERSNGSNGLGFDPRGRLISVQRAPGNEKVGILHPPGSEATLADSYDGRPFNRLNDLVVSRQGGIYLTDLDGVYYLPPAPNGAKGPGGRVTKVVDDIPNPNGVILSPDERVLYANDKDGEYLLAFDVAGDGTLRNRRNFARYKSVRVPGHKDPLIAEDNGADGLAVDNDGRLYVATNLGVEIFSPRGEHLGVLPVVWGGERFTLRKPQNVAFAGPDRKTLYIVGAGAVYKVRTLAQGISTRAK